METLLKPGPFTEISMLCVAPFTETVIDPSSWPVIRMLNLLADELPSISPSRPKFFSLQVPLRRPPSLEMLLFMSILLVSDLQRIASVSSDPPGFWI